MEPDALPEMTIRAFCNLYPYPGNPDVVSRMFDEQSIRLKKNQHETLFPDPATRPPFHGWVKVPTGPFESNPEKRAVLVD